MAKIASLLLAAGTVLLSVQSISAEIEQSKENTGKTDKTIKLKIITKDEGKPVSSWIYVTTEDGHGYTEGITEKGGEIPASEKRMTISVNNSPIGAKKDYYSGEMEVKPGAEETILEVTKVEPVSIVIRLTDSEKRPLTKQKYSLQLIIGNNVANEKYLFTNDEGITQINLASQDTYRIKYSYPDSMADYVSDPFMPRKLKDNVCDAQIPSVDDASFGIVFVEKLGDEEQIVSTMKNCEFFGPNLSSMFQMRNGQLRIMPISKGRGGLTTDFVIGEEYSYRLTYNISSVYDIAPGSEKFTVGKAGEKVKLYLIPRVRSNVSFEITSKEGKQLYRPYVWIRRSGSEKNKWQGCPVAQVAELPLGKYDIRVWERDHRLYDGTFVAKEGKQAVECKLEPSPKTIISVVDEDGNQIKNPRLAGLIRYLTMETGPYGYFFRFPAGGKTRFAFDDRYPCAVKIRCPGYASHIVILEKDKTEQKVVLTKERPIAFEFAMGDFELPEGASDVVFKRLTFVAESPARMRAAMIEMTDGKGSVSLEPGRYVPLIELSHSKVHPNLMTKAVVCQPIEITNETESVTITPAEIKPMKELLDGYRGS